MRKGKLLTTHQAFNPHAGPQASQSPAWDSDPVKTHSTWCQDPTKPSQKEFSMVQLSHPYMTTGQTTALTIWTFVAKVLCL